MEAFHYIFKASAVSNLTNLTFKTIVKTLLLVDFEKMSDIPESFVNLGMFLVNLVSTMLYLVQEYSVREARGLEHYSRLEILKYLGGEWEVRFNEQTLFITNSIFSQVSFKRIVRKIVGQVTFCLFPYCFFFYHTLSSTS